MLKRARPGGLGQVRRRVLFVTDAQEVGGAELYIRTLLAAAVSQFDTHLALSEAAAMDEFAEEAARLGVHVRRARLDRGRDPNPRGVAMAVRLIREIRPQVVHFVCASPRRNAEGIVAAWLARVPTRVATMQLVPPPTSGHQIVEAAKRWNRAIRFRALTRIIAVSEGGRRSLESQHQAPGDRILTIPNAVDVDAFARRRGADDLRADWGVPADAPLLGVMGRLHPQKGHRFLIDAMPHVWEAFPEAILAIVGAGPEEGRLRRLASERGSDGRVVFVGASREPARVLASLDIAVLPSLYEGMPFVAIEALAAGVPLVATDIDGTNEVVSHGATGVLVPPAQPDALADALIGLLADPDRRKALAAAGYEHARRAHDAREMVRRTFAVYAGAT